MSMSRAHENSFFSIIQEIFYVHRSCPWLRTSVSTYQGTINPFRTAVPLWARTTQTSSSLPPKRDWGPKRVNACCRVLPSQLATPPGFQVNHDPEGKPRTHACAYTRNALSSHFSTRGTRGISSQPHKEREPCTYVYKKRRLLQVVNEHSHAYINTRRESRHPSVDKQPP